MVENNSLLISPILIGINIYFFVITIIFYLLPHAKLVRNVFLTIGVSFLMYVISTRDLYYGDAKNYYQYYLMYPNIYDIKFEFLFDRMIALSKSLDLTPEVFFLITTSIQFLILFYSFLKLAKVLNLNQYTVFIVYLFISGFTFYYQTVETFREGIALAIVLLAITFYIEQKFKSAAFLLFLASMIHSSILILIPIVLIHKISNRKLFFLTTLLLLTSFFAEKIIVMFAGLLKLNDLLIRLELYKEFGQSQTILFRVFIIYFSLIVFYFFVEKKFAQDIKQQYLLKFYMYMSAFLFISIPFQELARRSLFRFNYLIPFFVVILISKGINSPKKRGLIVMIILLLSFFYHNIFLQNYKAMKGLLNW